MFVYIVDSHQGGHDERGALDETRVINSGHDTGGAGEPAAPGLAPALANAVFDATGLRVRQLPLKNFDLNYQVEETGVVG